MKKFTLLIDGHHVDTGNYEYYPYADKAITDFRGTRRTIMDLKTKKISEAEASEYIYARYCVGNEETHQRAIEAAHKASLKFRRISLSVRKKIYSDMYGLLLKHKEEFIQLLMLEGHPRKLSEWEFEGMRVGSSPETIGFYSHQIHKEIARYNNEILYWARKPDGVVCVSSPGNASASNSYNAILFFLTGNTVVLKPPLRAPISTIFLWEKIVYQALEKNNLPPGIVNIVLGNSQSIMNGWLVHPYVNDIMYFGDSQKGLDIGAKAFQAGKKPILELSGNDTLIVWKDADLEGASDSLLDCFLGSTQICMVPKIALVHGQIYDKFMNIFLSKVKKIKIGLPSDPDTIVSPVARIPDFYDFLNDALMKGGCLVHGGERVNHLDDEDKNGIFIRPSLVHIDYTDRIYNLRCLKEEIFFPLLPLIKVSGDDEGILNNMLHFVDSNRYGLRASLWIRSSRYLRKFVRELDNCGILRINTRHVGFAPYLSTHGGTRRSGGPFGEMNYFWQKASHLQGICRKYNESR